MLNRPLRASLVAQTVKNLPVTWETWVWSLVWEDSLEKGMAIHSSILAWWIPMDREAWRATVHGVSKSQIRLSNWAHNRPHWMVPASRFNHWLLWWLEGWEETDLAHVHHHLWLISAPALKKTITFKTNFYFFKLFLWKILSIHQSEKSSVIDPYESISYLQELSMHV